jgi:SAM-dependent methyltransferase
MTISTGSDKEHNMTTSPISACRACGSAHLQPVFSLGQTPLANSLLKEEDLVSEELFFPLEVVFCPQCALVQITETVSPELLFGEYLYFSSFSNTVVANAQSIVERLIQQRNLNPSHLVVEIASNDGYLLQFYQQAGVGVLGIEPARNIARAAEEKGIPTRCDFFSKALAENLAAEGLHADVIHGNNVLAHVAELNGVLAGFKILLKEDGVVVIEVPYVRDLIDGVEFDTIYHEHLCYYSLTALAALFEQHGLVIADVERIPIHGGSLRIFAEHSRGNLSGQYSQRVKDLLAEEHALGMHACPYYQRFGERVEALRAELVALLRRLKAEGNRIAVYGASAKGSTLMNYFGLGSEVLDYVVDVSTVKQGYYTPGTHLPILSPQRLLIDQPDYVLLLTWNFAKEILGQQAEYLAHGGYFILPIPQVRIIGAEEAGSL